MLELVDDVRAVTGVVIEDVVTATDDFRKGVQFPCIHF